MAWRGPRYEGEFPSLGPLILRWGHKFLPAPDDENNPLRLTDEQASLIILWYQIDPDSGERVFRRALLEMAKGWGKSPLAAYLAVAEFCGPVQFDGWDAKGEPKGRPWGTSGSPPALVQIAAVSEDQTDNTYGAIFQMLTARDGSVADELGINLGRTRLYLHGRSGELHPVTASAGSREGQRVTFAVMDETHLWKQDNRGVALAATIRRNAGKMGGSTFETTNAPTLGLKSVAERSAGEAGRHRGVLHYFKRPAIEPQPDATDEQLLEALDSVYGDAFWIDRQRLLKEIRDPATDWSDALRFYFNIPTAGTGRAVDPRRWAELAKPRDISAGTYIGAGFDGSINQDETWLVGCTADGYSFRIGRWHRPPNSPDYTVPRSEVHERIAWMFDHFDVGLFLFDPPKWWTEGEQWAQRYGEKRVLAFDTNQARRFAPAVDRWRTAIREGIHAHDGDPDLADHIKAAHLKKVQLAAAEDDGRTRYVIVKGEDRRKIDGAIADILAYEAAMTMPEYQPRKPRYGRGF